RYSKTVGVRAVQEVVAGAQHYGCTRAMVVSNIGRDRLPRWLIHGEKSAFVNAAPPR
ncbi:restriction endonuclease, partial [Mycobacteroides abscessus]|uniref:restriction endonuclease n=1 Tax=Mycobacteroides abscessus TaxID=36809 RepID=UPI000AF6CC37